VKLVDLILRSDKDLQPGSCRTLGARSGRYFRPSRMSVPDEVARRLMVTGLDVGGREQRVGPGAVPALLFSDRAVVEDLDLDPVVGVDEVSVSFLNFSDGPVAPFEVVLSGYADGEVLADVGRRVVGLGSTTVLAGQRCHVCVQPKSSFRAGRLVVPSDVAGDFRIVDVWVGLNSQLAAPGSLPATEHTEVVPQPEDCPLCRDTCPASAWITVAVENVSGADRSFTGALCGVGWLGRRSNRKDRRTR